MFAFNNLGNHSNGTETILPSFISTIKLYSSKEISVAKGSDFLIIKVFIPFSYN